MASRDGKYRAVVCEPGGAARQPFEAMLSFDDIARVLDDITAFIFPEVRERLGWRCPLPRGLVILCGDTARVRDDPPGDNRFGLVGSLVVVRRRGMGGLDSLTTKDVADVLAAIQKYDAAVDDLDAYELAVRHNCP